MTDFTPFAPSSSKISILAGNFVDDHGRILHLRGANVGSASKVCVRCGVPSGVVVAD